MTRRLSLPRSVEGILDVLRLLPRASIRLTWIVAAGTTVQAALPLVLTALTAVLIGSIPAAIRHGLSSAEGHRSLILLAAITAVILVQRISVPLLAAYAAALGRLVDRDLQERLIRVVNAPGGLAHLEDPHTLNLVTGAQGLGGQGTKPGQAVAALATLIPSWVQSLGSAALLGLFHWWLGLAWVLLWPVALYVLGSEYLRVGAVAGGYASAVRRSGYFRDIALTPQAAKEVRTLNLSPWLVDRFDAAWKTAMAPIWAARSPIRPTIWITTGAIGIGCFGTIGLLAHDAINGAVTLTGLALFARATVDAATFRAFDDANMELAHAAVSVPDLLSLERAMKTSQPPALRSLPTGTPTSAIAFQHVGFRYPGRDDDILADVSFQIPAGSSVAIVGLNGAGKTTLVKLLCGLYQPTSGRIAVDGVDLRTVDPQSWRQRISAIFQDFTRYHLTARENIALGAWDRRDCDALLREAADAAGASDVLAELPNGWDTVLSRQYTGGSDVSGGQWQRIALARALFAARAGANVLILDEPTASLDVRAEAELYDRFLDITRGLTTVLISHRFSTVRRADAIVVLERGHIVEHGTHEELLSRGGRYSTMFRLQSDRFAPVQEVEAGA